MPPKSKPIVELGTVDEVEGAFRAHVNYRDAAGRQVNFYGPKREERRRAKADLTQIRAAGAVGKTREQGLEIMAAEAKRIQLSANFEAEVRAAVQRQRSAEAQAEEPVDPDYMSDFDPDYMSDFDPDDEPWLVDHPSPSAPDDVAATPLSQKPPLTPAEATGALQIFRPFKARPEDLEHILSCRADPNTISTTPGDISPLRKVLTFAREEHVVKMRELLLQHGADESDEDRERWVTSRRAALFERVRIQEYRDDPRAYDPCAATLEMHM